MLCCARPKASFQCEVVLLDGQTIRYSKQNNVKTTTKGLFLFDLVCQHLNVIEKDYFGLKYYDHNSHIHWLDLDKALCDNGTLSKVIEHDLGCTFHFVVKFYAADPCALKEEVTRYQFFLQLKKDIYSLKLPCLSKQSTELSALALQSEIGDIDDNHKNSNYVSEFHFIPNQDQEFEKEVSRLHSSFKGLVPSVAEMQYLRKCRQLDMYGVEIHPVKGGAGVKYMLGVSPRGIETFKNKYRITVYYWPRIETVDFKDQFLKLKVKNKQGREMSLSFEMDSNRICQQVWKSIVDRHVFYRLPQNIQHTTWNKKHRYSGRTEAEILQSEVEREEPEVHRGSSKRFPASNHADQNKENIIEEKSNKMEEEPLKKKSMFNTSDAEQNTITKYMTPKSERRERNRKLQSLSDTENRQRKHRSRGRSSGEESDSPSKRRIRSRRRNQNNDSDGSEISTRRRRRRHYHTDTEASGRNTAEKLKYHNNNLHSQTDIRTHRRKRMSRAEDEQAKQILWQHIQKEHVEVDPNNQHEMLNDIAYTEVKTSGNSNPARAGRHHRNRNHSSKSSVISHHSYNTAIDDGMVMPLQVTTTVQQERRRTQQRSYEGTRNNRPPNKQQPGKDWDTRTSLSVEDFKNMPSNGGGKRHHHNNHQHGNHHHGNHHSNRRSRNLDNNHKFKTSNSHIVYSQI